MGQYTKEELGIIQHSLEMKCLYLSDEITEAIENESGESNQPLIDYLRSIHLKSKKLYKKTIKLRENFEE